MPYKSMKQMRYLHARKPKIAKRWDEEYGSPGKLPEMAALEEMGPMKKQGKKRKMGAC